MKAAPDLKVGDTVILVSLPKNSDLKLGQTATVAKIYESQEEYFIMLEKFSGVPIFAHRVRKLTPLDEELS